MFNFSKFICFLCLFISIEGANILFLNPVPSPSHHNWNRNIYYALAAKGHNVTVLSPDVDSEVTKNVHYLHMNGIYEAFYNGTDAVDLLNMAQLSPFENIDEFYGFNVLATEVSTKSDGFKALMAYPDTFKVDLVIIDITGGPFLLGFLKKFNYPPVASVTAFSYPPFMTLFDGGHRQNSYVPHYEMEYPNDMTLWQRIINHLVLWYDDYSFLTKLITAQEHLARKIFGEDLPSLLELGKRSSVLLTNTHFSVETLQPLPQNVIPVGGLQIRDPKPLAEDVKSFIEAGKRGSVIFSLGTNVKSDTLPKNIIQMFLNVFREMPEYNFIWKYESDLDLEIPKNVKLQGWVRQSDILAHPNIKAFISHCGLLGTQEAMWHGVPIIGIPFIADQFRNIVSVIRAGMGLRIDLKTVTHESFKGALKEILETPSYLENAKKRSRLFKDQMDKPLDRAVFWLEWTMRHKDDAQLIQNPVKTLGWFVGNGYDVLLIVFTPVILLLHAVLFVAIKLCTMPKAKKAKKD
ncbi:UDP-glucosyltransferase 2-like [Culicoides brevitarsis]|uniref:UDP-glucosyltransferase 2-like n=1 Tax=Culicoides brevitarsis TaxID=469753 RepID=UPI00307C47C5